MLADIYIIAQKAAKSMTVVPGQVVQVGRTWFWWFPPRLVNDEGAHQRRREPTLARHQAKLQD